MTAGVAYCLGHNRAWRDAEATVRQLEDSIREEALQTAAEAFRAGYALGRFGAVVQRRETVPEQRASCHACHGGTPNRHQPSDHDRSELEIHLPERQLGTSHLLIWPTSD
jgi:hypothetical protein